MVSRLKYGNTNTVLIRGTSGNLLVDTQVGYIHFSDEIFNRDKRIKYLPINEKESIIVKCEESRTFLHNMGIEGEILFTPSHSNDSISLVLDNGACFRNNLFLIQYMKLLKANA